MPAGAHDWVEAELLLGFTKLEYARSERISDRLLERGEREAVAASSERAAALMGWNYLDAARIEDFKAVLAVAPEGPALAAVKYRAWLTYNVVPGEKPVAPPRTGGPFDSAILIADYLLGRLRGPARVRRLGLGAGRGDAVADRDAAGPRPDAAGDRALRGGDAVAVGAALADAVHLHRPGAAGRRRPPRRGARRRSPRGAAWRRRTAR